MYIISYLVSCLVEFVINLVAWIMKVSASVKKCEKQFFGIDLPGEEDENSEINPSRDQLIQVIGVGRE